jgi:hypothetical protein
MTERLGPYTIAERKRRILERAAALGWPAVPGVNPNQRSWELQVEPGLPGYLDPLERALAELEAAAQRREELEREWRWQEQRRYENEQADLAHLADRIDRARR